MANYEIIVTVEADSPERAKEAVSFHIRTHMRLRDVSDAREVPTHPFTGKPVSAAQRESNGKEAIKWYQILTRTSDPVMLRGRMEARGLLSADNDPHLRDEPKP